MQLIIELLNYLTLYSAYAYWLIFLILLACGFGFPMPEDIILVSGGILASRGVTEFWMTCLVSMVGVLLGDGAVFTIGKVMGAKIKNTNIYKKIMSNEREKKVAAWFGQYGDRVIFFARFAPGLRMPLFLTAGVYQVSYLKFYVLDGFAAAISVPLWIWAGFLFGSNLEVLEQKIYQLQGGIYSVLGVILLGIMLVYVVKRRMRKASHSNSV